MKNFITTIVLMIFVLLNTHKLNAQFVTIPDPNFVTWLNNYGFSAAMNGNDLDTTNSLVTSAVSIDCSNSGIADLAGIQYFDNLSMLTCKYNSITTLPDLPASLTQLDCSYSSISGFLTLPPNLQILNCNFNQISGFPYLPQSLQYIYCHSNQISTLPQLPNSLIYLSCPLNLLTVVPSLPSGLQFLDCSYNLLSSLPALPNSLSELYCLGNNITLLPTLPNFLQTLNCNANSISSLPVLPGSLSELSCMGNLLTTLPSLPAGLTYLECHSNQLSSLPSLPTTLGNLNCNYNLLTDLPILPASLVSLDANNNQITAIPNFPAGLLSIIINNNLLTSIPALPDQLNTLSVHNNPLLSCLPELTSINTLNFTNTNVQCLPNYGNVTSSQPNLAGVPLCDIFNTNSCNFYYNIAGQIFGDDNTNCILEFNESLFAGIKVNLLQSGNLLQQTLSSQVGLYTFDTNLGTYDITVDTAGVPFVVGCPVSGILNSVLTVADSIDLGMDFGLQCKPGFDIGAWSVITQSGMFFPADTALIQIKAGDMAQFYNLTCANGISGTVTVTFTGPAQFGGNFPGSLVPFVALNTLTYTVPDFGALDVNTAFLFYMVTDTTAQSGQSICFTVSVTPVSGDNNPGNNNLSHCFGVVNSFDPNDKQVSPTDSIYQTTEWLTYTIRFQNTGTAPAQNIVLTDTLSSNVEEGTFSFLGSSHTCFINVTGNILKFTFPNINLPDSLSDEPNSHGYVQFKVKPEAGLPIGATIENTANIYFDFNPPVITNTTVNTIVSPTGIEEILPGGFAIYPNPAKNILNITSLEPGQHKVTISDITGRIVVKQNLYGYKNEISINDLSVGIYFVNVESELRNEIMKIVVN